MGQAAIFGGTFDPVHWGHLLVAEAALSQFGLDQVIWVAADHPPHKQGLAYEHRRLMVEQAISGHPAFVLSPTSADHSGPDYAIGTLVHLQYTYPNCRWYWIIGLDSFQTLPGWYHREQLIPSCEWLVAPRLVSLSSTTALFRGSARQESEIMAQYGELCQQVVKQLASQNISIRWHLLQMPIVGISSSLIRQYCHQRQSIRYLVPEEVRAYITSHNLYL